MVERNKQVKNLVIECNVEMVKTSTNNSIIKTKTKQTKVIECLSNMLNRMLV